MAPQTFDLESITLGEMVEVELASGHDFMVLLKSRTGRMMVARYLLASRQHERDTSSPVPVWESGPSPARRLQLDLGIAYRMGTHRSRTADTGRCGHTLSTAW
jgi:hypothetical protein